MKKKTVYFLIDCSGSMYGARGDAVNAAMEKVVTNVIPEVVKADNSELKIKFKVLGFSGEDKVVTILPETDLENFTEWKPIPGEAFNGGTPTGAAIQAVIQDIQGGSHGDIDPEALPPAIILISDGEPNGTNPTYDEVMKCAESGSSNCVDNFQRAIRVAIGMNVEDSGRESLKKFGNVSKTMRKDGISAYYDCSEEYVDEFAKILMSVTQNVSEKK